MSTWGMASNRLLNIKIEYDEIVLSYENYGRWNSQTIKIKLKDFYQDVLEVKDISSKSSKFLRNAHGKSGTWQNDVISETNTISGFKHFKISEIFS